MTPFLRRCTVTLLLIVGLLGAGSVAYGQTADSDTTATPRPAPGISPFSPDPWGVDDIDLSTVEAKRFDYGKMWTFDAPPVDYFENTYDFQPDSAWFRKARLGALRIPGCTASFASAHGLMLTNHHCGRDHATSVSRPGENILQNGFYASSLEEERRVEGLYADQLIAITDVTAEVDSALAQAQTDAERSDARESAFNRISQRLTQEYGGEAEGIRTEVISLYNGGRFSAYTFRRYSDVRLVMIPELQLGYFGGDTDNFTYPRYALDMALFRVYDDDGEPLQPAHYFTWAEEGSRPGDAVFVVGNPGSTLRLETVAQLKYRRDVQDRGVLSFYSSRVEALQAYAASTDEVSDALQNQIFGLRNALKLYRGRIRALNQPYIMTRRADAEQNFLDALQEEPELARQYGGLIDSLAAIQQQKREYAGAFQAFIALQNPTFSSATLRRAMLANQYLQRQEQGASEEQLAQVREQLSGVSQQPPILNRQYLTARFADFQAHLGPDHPITQQALQGRSPRAAAAALLNNSVLADSSQTAQALEMGALAADDPAVQLVQAIMPRYQEYRSAYAGLNARQQEVGRQLGRARYAVYGTRVPPDATFSLRLADGRVQSYNYNGTRAPAYTTFYGLLGHYHEYGAGTEWDLPERWRNLPSEFDLSTPVNLVSTNDITGGNSGSPLLNKDLEVVGLIFDGNIESLAGDYIYMPDRGMRSISVDVRGMIEALDVVYDADRLVREVTGQSFVPTEEAADAAASRTP